LLTRQEHEERREKKRREGDRRPLIDIKYLGTWLGCSLITNQGIAQNNALIKKILSMMINQ
jgi:hypothetical protein